MEENNNSTKSASKNKFYKWLVFLIILLAIFVAVQLIVSLTLSSKIKSVPSVTLYSYSPEVLLSDVESRAQFLAPRIQNTNFYVYKVQKGDNLWKIAKRNGYSVHTLIGCNPQLKTYNVAMNQKILIPSSGGSLHPVQKGDIWEKIAERYDIDLETLMNTNFKINSLNLGEYVFIPGKKPAVDLMNEEMQEKYALRSLFISPLGGRLTSAFGTRRHPVTGKVSTHGGIDIAAPTGTWVGAAADGVVILASTNVGHYGTAVYIDHKNGYITHYGHLSSYNVKVGQKVRAGQLIARSGATGRVTGPHLHFTVKKGGVSIDPLKFLW